MNLTDARKLAEELMDKHIPRSDRFMWSFEYMDRTRGIGLCSFRASNRNTISLNEDFTLLAPENEVKDVILHEIAHVLAGRTRGHDRVWQLYCLQIGGNGQRLHKSEATTQMLDAKSKYVAICPTCKENHYASRLGSAMKNGYMHCRPCHQRHGFSDANKLIYRINY
jgi:predicted SprT family Zn-dependent metalloprotease